MLLQNLDPHIAIIWTSFVFEIVGGKCKMYCSSNIVTEMNYGPGVDILWGPYYITHIL